MRRAGAPGRPRGSTRRQRAGDLAREPLPRHVRARPSRAAHGGGRGAARARHRARRGTGHRSPAGRGRRPARAAPEHPAERRSGAAAPAPRGEGRSGQRRLLPRARRLRGATRGARHGPGGRAARGHGLQAGRPRRRCLPDRAQVGRRRPQPQAAALPDLQRRRVRAGDLQGPRAPRARPLLRDRVDDHRRLRHRRRARLPIPARRVPAGLGAPRGRRHRGPRARIPRAGHPREGHQLRHRAAQGRGRLHLRRGDGAVQLDRGLPRRAAEQAAVPGRVGSLRHADGDQQRRDARQRAGDRPRRGAGVRRRSARRTRPARACSACPAGLPGRACTRCRSGSRCARCSRWAAE